ncbi:hypothetical protein B0H16DRAFT_1850703, partial [Mycena metata]
PKYTYLLRLHSVPTSCTQVATIAFIREYTSIPAPELYYYDCNAKNALGTPYMLMKRVRHLSH